MRKSERIDGALEGEGREKTGGDRETREGGYESVNGIDAQP